MQLLSCISKNTVKSEECLLQTYSIYKTNIERGKKAKRFLWRCSTELNQYNLSSICQDQPTAFNQRKGIIICLFWAYQKRKHMDCHTENTKNEGGGYHHFIIHKNPVWGGAHAQQEGLKHRTSNMVRLITPLLRALLLNHPKLSILFIC